MLNFLFAIYLSDIFVVLVSITHQTQLKIFWYHIDRQLEARRNTRYVPLFSFLEFENLVKRGPFCLISILKSLRRRYNVYLRSFWDLYKASYFVQD